MKVSEIQVKINVARREMEYWQDILRTKSCDGCESFYLGGCKKADGQTPPADVQKVGCPEWTWDEIPF